MTLIQRDIIEIDEELCDGCELCIPSCAEGAIQMVNGKAKLVNDALCDGIGNCLGDCPQDAITVIRRSASSYDEVLVEQHLKQLKKATVAKVPVAAVVAAPKPIASPGGG